MLKRRWHLLKEESVSTIRNLDHGCTGEIGSYKFSIFLAHGRTVIRISGPKAEWVLAKFFAIDFTLPHDRGRFG